MRALPPRSRDIERNWSVIQLRIMRALSPRNRDWSDGKRHATFRRKALGFLTYHRGCAFS